MKTLKILIIISCINILPLLIAAIYCAIKYGNKADNIIWLNIYGGISLCALIIFFAIFFYKTGTLKQVFSEIIAWINE